MASAASTAALAASLLQVWDSLCEPIGRLLDYRRVRVFRLATIDRTTIQRARIDTTFGASLNSRMGLGWRRRRLTANRA
jgi:hypothetical protein